MNRVVQATRRDFLRDAGFGLPAIAAADLLLRGGHLDAATTDAPIRRGIHFEAKASHIIHIFLGGGLSQVDSFDYKPELEKYHGKDMPESFGRTDAFFGKVGRLHRSHYPFKRRGKSGLWVSDLFPGLADVADELTVINSMVAETANHIPGIFQANTGFRQMGFPAMGSWLTYGLGSENEDLPGFVVLPDDSRHPERGRRRGQLDERASSPPSIRAWPSRPEAGRRSATSSPRAVPRPRNRKSAWR